MTDWLEKANTTFVWLSSLKKDWDSYCAEPIDPNSIKHARRLLGVMFARIPDLPEPSVGPVNSGNVGLSWYETSWELDAEVFPDGHVEYYYETQPEPDVEIEDAAANADEFVTFLSEQLRKIDG